MFYLHFLRAIRFWSFGGISGDAVSRLFNAVFTSHDILLIIFERGFSCSNCRMCSWQFALLYVAIRSFLASWNVKHLLWMLSLQTCLHLSSKKDYGNISVFVIRRTHSLCRLFQSWRWSGSGLLQTYQWCRLLSWIFMIYCPRLSFHCPSCVIYHSR